MMRTFETKDYGKVEVRIAMFDIDGTNLEEGIEIKGDDIGLVELHGWRDISELSSKDVNKLLQSYHTILDVFDITNKK
jgi:hypothetical protein